MEYINGSSKPETADGLSVLKSKVNEIIEEKRARDPEFREVWDKSRSEYETIGSIIRLRKEKGISQAQLAELTGNKQQVISRIENKENSPTLKTLCGILDVLGYEIKQSPKVR